MEIAQSFDEIRDYLIDKIESDNYSDITITENLVLRVNHYLPIEKKIEFIKYIVESALDESTGCFSPVRTNTYFNIGLLKWYCDISFDEIDNIAEIYDILEQSGIINIILKTVPQEEIQFIQNLIDDTIQDIEKYNISAAGIIHSMSNNAEELDGSLKNILEQIRNREGLEVLDEIKNVVGTD